MKKKLVIAEDSTGLVHEPNGVEIKVVGGSETLLNISDKDWKMLHQKLKTGRLNPDTVKQKYKASNE